MVKTLPKATKKKAAKASKKAAKKVAKKAAKASKNGVLKASPSNRMKEAMADIEETVIPPLQALNIGRMIVTVTGTSPLVVHNFDPKSRQQMMEKQTKKQKVTGKEARCPEEEFLNALYWIEGEAPKPKEDKATGQKTFAPKVVHEALTKGVFGLPAAAFGNACVSAARNTDHPMTVIKQALFISGDPEMPDWCIIKSPRPPEMDSRIVRLANGTPMERFRPKWKEWSTSLFLEYDRSLLSDDNVLNLLEIAGFFVGVAEGRPEKCRIGWGRFKVG